MINTKKIPTQWDLTPLFKNENDKNIQIIRKKVEEKSNQFINKWKNRNDYLEHPNVLKKTLDEYEDLAHNYGSYSTEIFYLNLRTQLNQDDPKLKALFNTAQTLAKKLENEGQFFFLRLSKVPRDKQKLFLNSPELTPYKHYLETVFKESKYLLSEPEEKILNLKSKTSYSNWVQMTSSFLSKEEREVINEKGKKEKQNLQIIINLTSHKNKKVRDSAAEAINDIMRRHIEVGEAELNSILENKKIDDELRGLERPDLGRHLADDIDSDVVDTLSKTVSKRFDISARYYTLKAKLMHVPILKYHERNVEYGEVDKKYSYNDAVMLVHNVFSKLDSEFAKIFEMFVTKGHIDVFPKKGKRGGAFCAYSLMINPTYILLNHTDQLNDVLTLAHECGHGINDELIKKKQHALTFGTPISTAEVASTFMEDFVLEELLKDANEELQLSIMMMKLNGDISTIFRQIAAYQFEQELHKEFRERGYLSKEDIGKLFRKHMHAYMGPAVEKSEGSENWWLYWNHIRYFFYNYSYASGLLISKALQANVKKDPKFINKVKEFLSAGRSDSPKNIFMKLGIDISDEKFWMKGLQEVEELLNKTEALAKKLKKI